MPKRKGGLGPMWKGFDSYLTEEFKASVSTASVVGDPRDESLVTKKQTAGSGVYSFTIDREKDRQQLDPGEEQPPGYIEPQVNGSHFNSTRVAGYRYVPHDPNDMTDAGLGTLYMRFIKRGDEYRYDNVPMAVYGSMTGEGVSRGKFVNSTLNHYNYEKQDTGGLFFTF